MNANKSLALLVAATLGVAACGGGSGRSMNPPPPPSNTAPAVTAIADRSADQDIPLSIDFGVDDRESGAGSLTVGAAADGTALFPADGVVLSGSGATRTLTLTPLEAATGTANIVIRAADPEGAVTTRSFVVAVNAKNNSIEAMTLETFAKTESDVPTTINGWTVQKDTDPAAFAGLIPVEEP
jgi:hypothetical protein